MVYSNETFGETLTFKYYSSNDDAVYDLAETLEWETNIVAGNVVEPFALSIATSTDIYVDLSSGWNWISINVEGEDMSLDSVLGSVENGIYIKGQEAYSSYYVGDNFAYEARSVHYSNKKNKKRKGIYGKASIKEVKELAEEGIESEIIHWVNDKEN